LKNNPRRRTPPRGKRKGKRNLFFLAEEKEKGEEMDQRGRTRVLISFLLTWPSYIGGRGERERKKKHVFHSSHNLRKKEGKE